MTRSILSAFCRAKAGLLTALAVLAALVSIPSDAVAQSRKELNVLEQRAKQFARAISTGQPDEFERLVREHFDPGMHRIPMPAHRSHIMSLWDMTRGLDFRRLEQPTAHSAFVVFGNRLTGGESIVFMRVESEPPHRISTANALSTLGARQPLKFPPPRAPARQRSKENIGRELDRYVKRLASVDTFSGVVLLAKDGEIVLQKAYGQADKEKRIDNRVDTRFNLASMHKMITAVAVAKLVAKGKLSYEDPLTKFLSGAPDESPFARVRIKHLVSGTSGLGFWFSPDNPADFPDRAPTSEDTLREVSQETLQFEPGTRFQYSNLGFLVLGPVIEKAAGMPYKDYVHENIYKPAGMENGDPPQESAGAAFAFAYLKTFDENGKPVFRRNDRVMPFVGPGESAGGGFATAADLLKFDRALRSGKLLAAEEVQRLLTPKPELGSNEYGYGFDVDIARGTAGHGGGSTGVSNTFEMFLRSGWTAVVMSNYTENTFEMCEPVVLKIRELVATRADSR